MSEATSTAKRLALIAVLVLSVMTTALLLGSYALLSSAAGTAWLGQQLQVRTGGALAWDAVEGTVAGPLTLRGVRVTQPGLTAAAERLALDWQPGALLRGELSVTALEIEGLRLELSESGAAEPAAPLRPSSIALPLEVSLSGVQLRDLQVLQNGEPLAQAEVITLEAGLVGRILDLQALVIRVPGVSLEGRGQLTLEDRMPLALAIDWAWAVPADTGPAPLSGTAGLQGELIWDDILSFALDYQLQTRGLDQLAPDLPSPLGLEGAISGAQAPDRLDIEQLGVHFHEVPAQLALGASLRALDTPEPRLQLEARWQQLQWPPLGDLPVAASDSGRLRLDGTPAHYRIDAEASLGGDTIPPGLWHLTGSGNTRELEIERAVGQVMEGQVELRGELAWSPQARWDLHLVGENLNPATLEEALAGELSVTATSRGDLGAGGELQASLDLEQLTGALLGYPLQLSTRARLQGETLTLDQLSAMSGANEIAAGGTVSPDSLDIAWQLRAADPGLFLPDSRGLVAGEGTLTGPLESPSLTAELASEQLLLQGLELRELQLALQAGLATDAPLGLTLSGHAPSAGEDAPELSLELAVSGSNRRHDLQLLAARGEQQIRASLAGGANEGLDAWRGELRELDLQDGALGRWRLQEPASLAASADAADLARACLARVDLAGTACTQLAWQRGGSSELGLDLADFPLQSLLPAVSSRVEGTLQASLAGDGEIAAQGKLSLSPGDIQLEAVDETRTLSHGGGSLSLGIDPGGLRANLAFDAPEGGRVDGRLALPALHSLPLAETQPLEGRLQAQLPDLSGLAAWIEEVSSTQGALSADLSLGGSLREPDIAGMLTLSDAAADIPAAGIRVQDTRLEIRSDPARPGRLLIGGGASSGGGSVQLTGEAFPGESTVQLDLAGRRFLAYDTVDARAYISPDLQLSWSDQLLRLRGRLEIPEASITPQLQFRPGAGAAEPQPAGQSVAVIAPSPDVVLINGPQQTAQEGRLPIRIDSEIEIVLGPRVDVNALGFISRLPGAVVLRNSPDQRGLVPVARGQLAIEDGTFRAFGQDLDIESGQIIFGGGLATEPELNLRAVRWIDDDPTVTAVGVIVTGPASAPTLTPFSRPPMDQAQIQSYLLTGRSSDSRENVLSIGTYLTPQLYVGYGYNLLRNTNEFNSLFSITPRIGVGGNFGEADNNLNMTISYEH